MPILSVCVPAHNAGHGLANTLRSILDQDTEIEVIVLDNASTDDTAAIARAFDDPRLRLVRNAQALPIGENWNKAVWHSTGRLVKVVRAGDILLPGALDKQREVMGDNGIAVCAARFQQLDANGWIQRTDLGLRNLLGPKDTRSLMRAIIRRGPEDFGPTATAVFRRMDFDRVGGFRGDLVSAMDVDLFARVSAFGRFLGMAENLVGRCVPRIAVPDKVDGHLAETMRFQHRLGAEYPQLIGRATLLSGDLRLARAAAARLRLRASARFARRPEPR